jgi:putative restriction endonuclease
LEHARVDTKDEEIRMAAFARCARLAQEYSGAVPWAAITQGFQFEGARVYLGSRPRGIHRPSQMSRGVLSIKTNRPREGRSARYDDALSSDGYFSYAFQGTDPTNRDNTCLREAFDDQTPLIYFYGISPGVYQILFPCYLTDWEPARLYVTIAVGSQYELNLREPIARAYHIDRRYTTIEAKVRLHQAEFRELVLLAYGQRCAISGLPIVGLLEAAHIVPDRDERGHPEVSNGLCLSTLHHAAYDRNLLGIDPDGIIHIPDAVLKQHDGPTLEKALKGFHGARISFPRHTDDRPNRNYLAERFELFQRGS